MDYRKISKLSSARKNHEKSSILLEKEKNKLHKQLGDLGCLNCKVYYKDLEKPFHDRFKNCTLCLVSPQARELHLKICNLINEDEKNTYRVYAKILFDELSKYAPKIIDRRTKKTFTWKEFFGESFSCLDSNKVRKLILMFEEDDYFYDFL